MSDEKQIAALWEEIRRLWRSYRWWWISGVVWTAIDPLLLLFLFLVTHRRGSFVPPWLVALFVAWVVGLFVGGSALLWFGARARAKIGALWEPLPLEARAEAMRPFAASAKRRVPVGPMAELVSPFLRQLSRASELTPAATPDARGDEGSPAEKMP